jgi:hypothetical protein
MSELSPAAQAVLIAEAKSRCLREQRGCHPNDSDWNGCWICVHRKGVAAALRAAADQVVPGSPDMDDKLMAIRYRLCSIADELAAS